MAEDPYYNRRIRNTPAHRYINIKAAQIVGIGCLIGVGLYYLKKYTFGYPAIPPGRDELMLEMLEDREKLRRYRAEPLRYSTEIGKLLIAEKAAKVEEEKKASAAKVEEEKKAPAAKVEEKVLTPSVKTE